MSSFGSNTNTTTRSKNAAYIGTILILIVIIAALVFALLGNRSNPNSSPNSSTSDVDLKITKCEATVGQEFAYWNTGQEYFSWTVTIAVENRGSDNATGTELSVEMKAGNKTIDSVNNTLSIPAHWSTTGPINIVAIDTEMSYGDWKCIATIYSNNQIIDQNTLNLTI